MFKYFCFILLLAVASQAFPEVRFSKNNVGNTLDLWEDAKKVLEGFRQNLLKMINDSDENLRKTAVEFNKQVEIVKSENKQDVQEIVKSGVYQIKKIISDAEAKGINVAKCMKGEENKIKELEKKFADTSKACVDGKSTAAVLVGEKAMTEIKKFMNKYEEFKKKLETCKSSANESVCINTVVEEILDQSIEISFNISERVVAAQTQIDAIKVGVEKCVKGKTLAIGNENSKIVKDFSTCVQDLKPIIM